MLGKHDISELLYLLNFYLEESIWISSFALSAPAASRFPKGADLHLAESWTQLEIQMQLFTANRWGNNPCEWRVDRWDTSRPLQVVSVHPRTGQCYSRHEPTLLLTEYLRQKKKTKNQNKNQTKPKQHPSHTIANIASMETKETRDW